MKWALIGALIGLLIDILIIAAVVWLFFLVVKSLIRYLRSSKKGDIFSKQTKEDKRTIIHDL